MGPLVGSALEFGFGSGSRSEGKSGSRSEWKSGSRSGSGSESMSGSEVIEDEVR